MESDKTIGLSHEMGLHDTPPLALNYVDKCRYSYGVYISQLIRFARVSSHVDDFNIRIKVLTPKLLTQ